MLRDGCDGCVWWRHTLGTFRSSRSGSFGCPGGGGFRLSASVAPGVSGSEWYWPVVGSASSGVGHCGVPPNEHSLSISGGGGTRMDWSSRSLGLLH